MTSNEPGTAQRSKGEAVVRDIRRQIVRGELTPGSQLPTWDELERCYSVTRSTISGVLGRLKRDGFIVSSSTRGTFVAERLPHLHRYALVFPAQPGTRDWNRFWWTLANQAVVMQGQGVRELPCFYGVNDRPDNPVHTLLEREVASERLAGLILVGQPQVLSTALRQQPGLPIVGIWSEVFRDGIPSVYVDRKAFVQRSVQYLVSRGRRRVAVLTSVTDSFSTLPEEIRAHGMESRPHWHLPVHPLYPQSVPPIMRLLLDRPPEERPDALVITDDNLVEQAVEGISAAKVSVPDDLEIVAHCAWPLPSGLGVPARRLGYSARQVIECCIGVIDQMRRGERPPTAQLVGPLFEEEVRGG